MLDSKETVSAAVMCVCCQFLLSVRVVTHKGVVWCPFRLDTTWPSYEIQDKGDCSEPVCLLA